MAKMQLKKSEVKILGLSSLGGMLEFYDFIIFVFFTNVISSLFFPSTFSPFWAAMNTYGAFAAGYFARPLGGIIMAHFGDKSGRKKMFMLSILLMVIPTFVLGLMPTFESIGYVAPIVLLIVRILQGIAIGGELPGAWVFVYEHSNQHSLGFHLGIFTSAVVSGILLGSIVTLAVNMSFTQEEIKEYAWRIPFVLGGIFGIISLFLRKFLNETPVFQEILALKQTQNFPIKEVFKTSQLGAVKSFFSTWILTGCVVISVLLTPNLLSKVFELSPISKVVYQVIAIFFLASGNVFAGVLSDRIGIKNASAIFGVALVGFALCFYYMLGYGKGLAQYFDVILLVYYLMAFSAGLMVFTPIVMVQSFPAMIRYSGISFAYNLSYALFGGLTPIFFAWAMESDWIIMLGVYMSILGILAIVIGRVHRG
ncbi:MFS transporter [Helicobacter sp. CaF467b]|uniref:MFS transporter n=1 Tax=Helicobacter sp. CaF467b TaxID=2919923 RepID=UPI001F58B43F|nr:MFS transporter [Helicobacter sp. CaF467b]MCI2235272.1 MFS transporter [Helicobacter sp. CaF467b]